MTVAPGAIVSDRYRIVEQLGEGGMGAVFRAEHVHMKKMVALKVLLSEVAKHPEIVARFEREAVAAGNIDHPNVVTATDFGRLPDGSFFLVMEYVPGRSLRAELANGPLAPERALRIASGILAAIDAAHSKNIVHRDLKPENVMLVARDGDPDFVKVLDFGIAKVDLFAAAAGAAPDAPGLTRSGAVMGTPEYMPPEQALGQSVDARSDLYALGIILYEMLVGAPPFHGQAISVMRRQVLEAAPPLPESVLAVVPAVAPVLEKVLQKEPANRHASAKELRAELAALIDGSPASASALAVAGTERPGPDVPTPKPEAGLPSGSTRPSAAPSSGKKSVVLGAAGVLALVAVIGVFASSSSKGRPTAARSSHAAGSASPVAKLAGASTASAAVEHATADASASEAGPVALDDEEDAPAPASSEQKSKAGTAKAGKRAAPKPAPRRTGPGGIYIPPPDTWFK